MNERRFYLLEKYFNAGDNGIAWNLLSTSIMKEHDYANLEEGDRPYHFLLNYEYIRRKPEVINQTEIITEKGQAAYLFEKSKRDLKVSELEKEKKFKDQLVL